MEQGHTPQLTYSPQEVQIPQNLVKPPRPWLKIIMFLILGIFLFTGLVFASYLLASNKQAQPTPTSSPLTLPTSTPDPTTNWKTYTDTKYGFSMKYPEDWEFKPCTDILCGSFTEKLSGKEIIIIEGVSDACGNVTSEPSFANAEQTAICQCAAGGVGETIDCDSPSETQIITNKYGVNGYRFLLRKLVNEEANGFRGPYTVVFFPKQVLSGGTLYEYGLNFEVINQNILSKFDQLFQTFQFISKGSSIEKVLCPDPRPEACTMECIANPPYICGSDGKSYCSTCQACSNPKIEWYITQETPCSAQ